MAVTQPVLPQGQGVDLILDTGVGRVTMKPLPEIPLETQTMAISGSITQPQCPYLARCGALKCPLYMSHRGRPPRRDNCKYGRDLAIVLKGEMADYRRNWTTPSTPRKRLLYKYQRLTPKISQGRRGRATPITSRVYGVSGALPKKRPRKQENDEWFIVADPGYPLQRVDPEKMARFGLKLTKEA